MVLRATSRNARAKGDDSALRGVPNWGAADWLVKGRPPGRLQLGTSGDAQVRGYYSALRGAPEC